MQRSLGRRAPRGDGDARSAKGERLVLLTARPDATRADAIIHLRKMGATELMIPAEVIILPDFPILASGKTDLVALDNMLRARVKV